ncbi:MAG: hypothetical protein IJ149_08900 [Oscillospiraceae bacterium]|nr:hypothetical protein [Oscillospiraceae bacterium]
MEVQLFKRCGIKGTDIKKPAFEYLLRLELLVRKGEYSDFIRGLTPLLGQLYMLVLDTQCGINVKKYVSRGKWDYNKGIGVNLLLLMFVFFVR